MKNKIIIIFLLFIISVSWYSYTIFIQTRNIKEVFEFIRENNIEEVKSYIQDGNYLNVTNKSGRSLLIAAVMSEQVKIVDMLVNAGIDTDKKSRKEQMTALKFTDRILTSEPLPGTC